MASIHADIEGLTALAASCRHHAFAMRAGGNAPAVGSAFQATSAAVADVHTNAYVAEARFAERLAATGNTGRGLGEQARVDHRHGLDGRNPADSDADRCLGHPAS